MQMRSFLFIAILFSCVTRLQAQNANPKLDLPAATKAKNTFKPLVDFTGSLGAAHYYGDLTEDSKILSQPSFDISSGIAYYFSPKFSVKGNVSYMQVKANDSKNSRSDLKARNLNFKSNIIEVITAIEYDFINITGGNHKFAPYIFTGVGIFHFSPTTVDRKGNKQKLSKLGTEGQGLPGFAAPYKTTGVVLPIGLGFKVNVQDNISLAMEFNYRVTNTDYLDDVSGPVYPDQNLLAQKNPDLPGLAYRGDELLGGKPYPGKFLPRGNPDKKDVYYTAQFRLSYRLKGKKTEE